MCYLSIIVVSESKSELIKLLMAVIYWTYNRTWINDLLSDSAGWTSVFRNMFAANSTQLHDWFRKSTSCEIKQRRCQLSCSYCWNHVLLLLTAWERGTFNSFPRRCSEHFRCRVLRSRCPSPRVCVSVWSGISSTSTSEPNRRHAEVCESRSSARSPSVQQELRAVRSRHQTRATPQQNLHQIHLEPEQQRTGVRLQAEAAHSDTGSADSVLRLRESAYWG